MPRPGPALFELIRGGGGPTVPARSAPTGKPLVKVTPKVAPASVQSDEPPVPPAATPSDKAWASWSGKGTWKRLAEPVTVRTSTVLIAAGVAVAVLVLTWAIGYTSGKTQGEESAKRDLGPNIKPENVPLNPGLVSAPPQAPEVRPQEPKTPTVERQAPAFASPSSDPRIAGNNYLLLASGMDKEASDRLVQFLNQGGLPAFAAVDKPASGSNNRGSYTVFASRGITSDEYKNRAGVRTEVEALAGRLGKQWQKDKKGQTDFSQAYWQKFKG